MRFNEEELEVIFQALKFQFLYGKDAEDNEQLKAILNTVAKYLGKTDGL